MYFASSHIWNRLEQYGDILCGMDKGTGTSWLAINTKTKRVAFLTDAGLKLVPKPIDCKSRGLLVMDWVRFLGLILKFLFQK